jgi:hypothetical protein
MVPWWMNTVGERGRLSGNPEKPEQLRGLTKPVFCKEGYRIKRKRDGKAKLCRY